nr:hypothetical protein [Tanacetum cinerariifolium]
MSNQNVNLTGYITRIPERIPLCRTMPLNLCSREAKCNVGPLPTDCPYKIRSSCLMANHKETSEETKHWINFGFRMPGWIGSAGKNEPTGPDESTWQTSRVR